MPVKIQSDLPAKEILEAENIFVMDEDQASHQDIRPLQIAILNLMPVKEDTEWHLLRSMSNTPLQVDITFVKISTHNSTHTSANHLNKFYVTFDDIKHRKFDGMIITGAPVEQMPFEDVDYWPELCKIMEWTKTNVTSTFHICWGAQAALYYHYGLNKQEIGKKLFGIYRHKVMNRRTPLVRGFDDEFWVPHSRYTEVSKEAIYGCDKLTVLAESEEAGVCLCIAQNGRQIFVQGHFEYDRRTLENEYKRDVNKGLDIQVPKNYYPDNDPNNKPNLLWRAHANTLYTNWLNYYVYQLTPYDMDTIGEDRVYSHAAACSLVVESNG